MKLYELIGVMSEDINVEVWNEYDALVSEYNGRDSIGLEYNNCDVTGLTFCDNTISVWIKEA